MSEEGVTRFSSTMKDEVEGEEEEGEEEDRFFMRFFAAAEILRSETSEYIAQKKKNK